MRLIVRSRGADASGRRTTRAAVSLVLAATLVASTGVFARPAAQPGPDPDVQRAYQFRLEGRTAEARDILEECLGKEPGNGLAHYELARTYLYMCPNSPGEMEKRVDKARTEIERALATDPDDPVYRYMAAKIQFFESYMAIHKDQSNARTHIDNMRHAFEHVLECKPDYGEVLLNLVELYGAIPPEMGQDRDKAAEYAEQLKTVDHVLAAKAHCILMPEDFDRVAYWEGLKEEYPSDSRVLRALGKAYLRDFRTEQGTECLRQAVQLDPSDPTPYLLIARYNMMRARREPGSRQEALESAAGSLNDYLDTGPIAPLKAWTYGQLASIYQGMDNRDEGERCRQQAAAADAFYSRAFAVPSGDLFVAPGVISHCHDYLFRPF